MSDDRNPKLPGPTGVGFFGTIAMFQATISIVKTVFSWLFGLVIEQVVLDQALGAHVISYMNYNHRRFTIGKKVYEGELIVTGKQIGRAHV